MRQHDDAGTRPFCFRTPSGAVRAASREEVMQLAAWSAGLAHARKDHRYYELVEETLPEGVEYRYLVVEDDAGALRAVQPVFLRDLDLVTGAGARLRRAVALLRRLVPRLLVVRALVVGCVTGEGDLAVPRDADQAWVARCLHDALLAYARAARARLVVLKEFSAAYRPALACFVENGYTRVPSFPMARLDLGYASFDDFVARALGRSTRRSLRRNLRRADAAAPITLRVTSDISDEVDELYPLYLNVYGRARFRFELLTREYLASLGRRMPDRVRFFVWRQRGRAVAFSVCIVHGDTVYDDYLGLDYGVALDLHLYFYTLRDIIEWAIEHGFRHYCSSALNYDPKRRFRCRLVPLDLYVTHTSPLLNRLVARLLPFLEPTRRDVALRAFSDYAALWGDAWPARTGQIAASARSFTLRARSALRSGSRG